MATTLKIVKWTLLSLAALVLGLILLAIFIDWNWVGDYAAREISQQTGRKFTIRDLDVELWSLRPHLQATHIHFENAPWGEPAQMVKLGALKTSIDLVQLIKGRMVIPELIIDKPVVHLEKSRRGKANWQLNNNAVPEKPSKQKAEPAASTERSELPAIGKLVIRDGQITYRDPAAKQAMALAIANISGSTFGPAGNVTLEGKGQLQDQSWRLDFNGGSFEKLVATHAPYPVHLRFDMGEMRARVDGRLTESVKLTGGEVKFSLKGPGLKMLSSLLGPNAPRLPPYDMEGSITRAGKIWHVRDFRAEVGGSDLQGEFAFDTGGQKPMLKADLMTHRLDYADFAGLTAPSKRRQQKPKPLDLKFLRVMDAVVNIHGDKILAPRVAARDVRTAAMLENGRLRIASLSVGVGGGRVRAQAVLDANPEPFKGSLQTDIRRLDLSKLSDAAQTAGSTEGIVDGHIEVSVTGASAQAVAKNGGALAMLERLVVKDSHVTYALPERKTKLRITAGSVMSDGTRQIKLHGKGRYRGEPFKFDFTGSPLLELASTKTNKPYAIKVNANGANTNIAVAGTLQKPLALRDIDLRLSVKGAGTDRLAAALDKPLPNLPPYSLQGRLQRQGAAWTMDDFKSRVGESDLTGDIAIGTGGELPFIKADLISRKLDYVDFKTVTAAKSDKENADNAEQQEEKAATRKAGKPAEPPFDLAPLQNFNARISYKGKEIIAPNLPLEDVALDIVLQDGRLAVEPFNLGVADGTVRSALAVDSSTPIRGNLTTQVDHVDIQKLVKPYDLKATFGILNGRANVSIVGATEEQIAAAAEQTALTFIHSFVIKNTQFAYRDPDSQIDVKTTIATTKTSNGAEPITIKSRGRYQGEAFSLDVGAGSLLRLLDEQRPYPIEARVEVAKTKASLKGDVTRPLDIKGLNLALSLNGPNPSKLEKLADLPLPDLPPYKIKGQVSHEGAIWRLDNFAGKVGDSDLAGDIEAQTLRDPRPLLVANLVSRKLDLDDLGGLIGAAPDTGPSEAESRQQQQEAKTETKTATVLPRDPIDLSTLSAIDARVSFNGKRVQTSLPIDDVRVKADLDNGRLILKPVNFRVAGGDIRSRVRLDGSDRPLHAMLQTEVSQVNLKEIMRGSGFAQKSVGNIGGRAHLNATGDSVAALMAALDGQLSLVMKGGEIDSLLIELAGLDVTQAVGDLVGDRERVPIRCAFTDLKARDGQVRIKPFVVDTTDTIFNGEGKMDLDKESIDFVIAPHPKDFSLFEAATPLHIAGRFSALKFYPDDSAIARIAAAVALGVVATPIAAVIPLVEPGTGQNSDCNALLNTSKEAQRTKKASPSHEEEQSPASFIERTHGP